jgi:hypothetical protein
MPLHHELRTIAVFLASSPSDVAAACAVSKLWYDAIHPCMSWAIPLSLYARGEVTAQAGAVLLCLARAPDAVLREFSARVVAKAPMLLRKVYNIFGKRPESVRGCLARAAQKGGYQWVWPTTRRCLDGCITPGTAWVGLSSNIVTRRRTRSCNGYDVMQEHNRWVRQRTVTDVPRILDIGGGCLTPHPFCCDPSGWTDTLVGGKQGWKDLLREVTDTHKPVAHQNRVLSLCQCIMHCAMGFNPAEDTECADIAAASYHLSDQCCPIGRAWYLLGEVGVRAESEQGAMWQSHIGL